MLSGEEIIRISEQNKLERSDVYKVRAIYGSMCRMSQ